MDHVFCMCSFAGEELVLQWEGLDHIGSIPVDYLIESSYSDAKIQKMVLDKTPTPVKVSRMHCKGKRLACH